MRRAFSLSNETFSALLARQTIGSEENHGQNEGGAAVAALDRACGLGRADANPKHQSSLKWKLGEIRKQLSSDKGWRFQWWLQPVDRREDAEVALELTEYERKMLGHGYMDNLFLRGTITRLPTGRPSPIEARSLEKNDAEVEERLLNAVIDAIEPWVEKSRLKQKVR